MRVHTTYLLLGLASVLGVAAVFAPFTYGISPFDTVWAAVSLGSTGQTSSFRFFQESEHWRLGLPFFLAVPLGVLTARLAGAGALHRSERAIAFGLALGVVAVTLSNYLGGLPSSEELSTEKLSSEELSAKDWLQGLLPLLMLVAGALIVAHLRRRRVSPDLMAPAALILVYLPNSVLCLLGFAGNWEIGAYLALAATASYAAAVWQIRVVGGCTVRGSQFGG